MISASDRENAVMLINEAVSAGAELSNACNELGLSDRTYFRWKKRKESIGSYEDMRPSCIHPEPANKIAAHERRQILDTINSPKYADMPPCEIVPALADEGIFIASESTFYRVLHEEKMQNHRGRSDAPHHRPIATYAATAPNQVWMWDITYLNGPIRGRFYYLYLFSDLYDRDIVGWEVWETEDTQHASKLIRRICLKQKRLTTQPLVLHSDNGTPMKGATMLETLYKLGITPSNSRPRVSNDNAYAESLFKTLKYRPNYQPKGFASLEEARRWVTGFVRWYRYEHHHSGIKFLHTSDLHEGRGTDILAKRHDLYELVKEQHPERWNGRSTRDWTLPDSVYLNPAQTSETEPAVKIV
jgi:putative transposase